MREVWAEAGAGAETEAGTAGTRKQPSLCPGRGRSLASREAENPLSLDFLMMSVGMARLLLSAGFSGQLGRPSLVCNAAMSPGLFNLSLSSVAFSAEAL